MVPILIMIWRSLICDPSMKLKSNSGHVNKETRGSFIKRTPSISKGQSLIGFQAEESAKPEAAYEYSIVCTYIPHHNIFRTRNEIINLPFTFYVRGYSFDSSDPT